MIIERVELHLLAMTLVQALETSFGGRSLDRPTPLVAVYADGLVGWGECVAFDGPWYSYETIETAWHMMKDHLIPRLLGQDIRDPADVARLFAPIRGHPMARAALETAVWDLHAQQAGVSLARLLGGERAKVPVGVSVGIQATVDELLQVVTAYIEAGYGRVKLKIKPGWDIAPTRAVRARWPGLQLQVDANSAYTLDDQAIFLALDELDLLLIEQPLHHDDLVDHAALQAMLHTPVCLDESIRSAEHARWALQLDACRVINIKTGRVGGLSAARQIHDLCAAADMPVWCGGMLETNIGRAANLALASLPNFRLPGDISASARYYRQDIAVPNFVLNDDSTITVPTAVGLGTTILPSRLASARVRRYEARAENTPRLGAF